MLSLIAPTPLPTLLVNVTHVPRIETVDSPWTAFVAVATLLLAVATFAMAAYTRSLAEETKQSLRVSRDALDNERTAMKAEQERHMDGFMPHLALIPRTEERALQEPGVIGLFLVLYIRNIGVGFAKNINIVHSNTSRGSQMFVYPSPIALGVGDERMLAAHAHGNSNTFLGYQVTYEDAFGRTFESAIDGPVMPGSRYRSRQLKA